MILKQIFHAVKLAPDLLLVDFIFKKLEAKLKAQRADYKLFAKNVGINIRNSAIGENPHNIARPTNGAYSSAKATIATANNGKVSREEERALIKRAISEKHPVFADDLARAYVPSMHKKDGYYSLVMHGSSNTIELWGKEVNTDAAYKILQSRNDYEGEPILLLSCKTGVESRKGDCIGQQMAKLLNKPVYAPKGLLSLHSDGTMTVEINVGREKRIVDVDMKYIDITFNYFEPVYK